MNYIKASILRQLLFSFLAFGLVVASIFPFYAGFFVEFKPGLYAWFVGGCMVAGLTIEVGNFYLVKFILLRKMSKLAMITTAISNKDITQTCGLKSDDMMGDMANGMNQMTETLRSMIHQINADAEELKTASSEMRNLMGSSSSDMQNQLEQVSRVASAMQDMSASASEIARHADAECRAR